MATDGDADYSGYTDEQLTEAAYNVDRGAIRSMHSACWTSRSGGATQAAPAAAEPVRALTPEFHADGREYFRIWIVNLALTIVTLGNLFRLGEGAQAPLLLQQHLARGQRIRVSADPIKILKGRVIAAAAAVTYFAATRYSVFATLVVFGSSPR